MSKRKTRLWGSSRLHQRPMCTVDGVVAQMALPPRCAGIMFVFETKAAARDWDGKDAVLFEMTPDRVTP